jgi:membrane-associated protease RseP (regulator of RpoE activity)
MPRFLLHGGLLLATLLTTTAVGAVFWENFRRGRPIDQELATILRIFREPSILLTGLPFSVTLLFILMAHEMGHYLVCMRNGVDASLPYFLPAPSLIGTFGAFIRIRSPIFSKRVLFDIGVAGPIAGFLALIPALLLGLSLSKVVPGIGRQGELIFGTPLVQRAFEQIFFPGVAAVDIYLHPVARAAWVGVFATALNLLPIGQLDGGHILYAVAGRRYKLLSRLFLVALIPLGFLYWPWWGWALFLLLFGMKHPAIFDSSEIDPRRKKLGWVALTILVLTFMPVPLHTGA